MITNIVSLKPVYHAKPKHTKHRYNWDEKLSFLIMGGFVAWTLACVWWAYNG